MKRRAGSLSLGDKIVGGMSEGKCIGCTGRPRGRRKVQSW